MGGNPNSEPSLREIFLQALERSNPQERAAYLDGACRGDARLRGQVEGLLQNDRQDSFLERPAVELEKAVATATHEPQGEGPGTVIGRYKLLQELGEGGCGVVYMAEQLFTFLHHCVTH